VFIYLNLPYDLCEEKLNYRGCVTSRSCEHMLSTYYLRTLAWKSSGYSAWLFVSFIYSYDDVDGFDLILFDIYVLINVIDDFP
jgi:hypothetical protein